MQKLVFCIILILLNSLLFSQNFTQVTGYGFGNGVINPIPTFADLDGDLNLDMLMGNSSGSISHYEKNGNSLYEFDLVELDFISVNDSYASPVLYDIDNDGLFDLIVGIHSGNIIHYEQTAINSYDFELISEDMVGYLCGRSQPAIIDLDNDGLLDLLVGEGNGNINHFEQSSPDSYEFDYITDTFSDIEIGEWVEEFPGGPVFWVGGFSSPYLGDVDNDGLLEMFIGSEYYGHFLYRQSEDDPFEFELINDNFLYSNTLHTRLYDLDDDGLMDFFASSKGDIRHYEQEVVGSSIQPEPGSMIF